jgi:hypothetical protein
MKEDLPSKRIRHTKHLKHREQQPRKQNGQMEQTQQQQIQSSPAKSAATEVDGNADMSSADAVPNTPIILSSSTSSSPRSTQSKNDSSLSISQKKKSLPPRKCKNKTVVSSSKAESVLSPSDDQHQDLLPQSQSSTKRLGRPLEYSPELPPLCDDIAVMEDETIRHLRRRIKNRDACRKSRQKRLDVMSRLESEVSCLMSKIEQLKRANESKEEARLVLIKSFEIERRMFEERYMNLWCIYHSMLIRIFIEQNS